MRISIRSMLLLLVVITLPLAGIYNRYNGKRQLANFLATVQDGSDQDKSIGIVRWSYELDGWYNYTNRKNNYHGSKWIRDLFGDDAMAYIKRASVSIASEDHAATANRLLGNTDSLRGLEELHLSFSAGIEFDCQCLDGLDDVRTLKLTGLTLEETDFRAISRMKDLEVLFIAGCRFKAESAASLAEAQHLAWIKVSQTFGTSEETLTMREQLPQVYISYDSRER